ncbi:MAG: hypothetical protein CM15mP120_21090 [Pseudomonadota bacterium]|nr:MAG: hypothetical protein CM15mP120_21090 [Pseudomonadota bacterium]
MSYKPYLSTYAQLNRHQSTLAAQERMRKHLDFSDRQSFENARKGFIATLDPMTIKRDDGHITFDLAHMSFLDSEAPDTVNPSLWRQAQLNAQHHGLFEVCDGLYQSLIRYSQYDLNPWQQWLDCY